MAITIFIELLLVGGTSIIRKIPKANITMHILVTARGRTLMVINGGKPETLYTVSDETSINNIKISAQNDNDAIVPMYDTNISSGLTRFTVNNDLSFLQTQYMDD